VSPTDDHAIHPPASGPALGHVGTYRRRMPVSLERMFENALDWEHLPHLHDGSFAAIECLEAGPWGWRARTEDLRGRTSLLELRLDRTLHRWITRNLEGPNAGAEIWTHAFELAPRSLEVVVDFFVPGIDDERREAAGRSYADLYERLYDEDERMMCERQAELDRRAAAPAPEPLSLGPATALELPMTVTFAGRAWRIRHGGEGLLVHADRCPHQLGPLEANDEPTEVRCPWHGYRFDAVSGACLTGQPCRLPEPPVLEQDGDGHVWLRRRSAS
jgi:nitrite reductase/ring-hydroxylating ferredoxin subunit